MAQLLSAYIATQQPKPPERKETDYGALISIALALSPVFFGKSSVRPAGAPENTQDGQTRNGGSTGSLSVRVNNYNHNVNANTNNTVVKGDYTWVRRVVKQPFRMITGGQGSGKSTQERYWINLLKGEGWHIICVNPNTTSDSWKGVKVIQKISEIDTFLKEFPQWIDRRQEEARAKGIDEDKYLQMVSDRQGEEGRVAVFFMEANQFELKHVNPSAWADALRASLTDIRKWGFTVCLSCQAGKQSTISSKLKGFADNLKEAPQVECIATTNEKGDAVSSGEGILRLPGQKPERIALPNYPDSKDFTKTKENEREQRAGHSRSAGQTQGTPTQTSNSNNSTVDNPSSPVLPVGDDNSKSSTTRQLSRREIIADKICKSLAGKGRVKVSSLARSCNALRVYLENKFQTTSFDNDELVREVHIILDISTMKEEGVVYGDRDKSGLIIPNKNNEFESCKRKY